MKNLFIHIGWPKTGSTALQEFCHANREALSAAGLAYYACFGSACGSIVRALRKAEPLDDARRRLLDWAKQQQAANVLISSEGFSGAAPDRLEAFFDPAAWASITVIGYLRPQEAFFEGWYKQQVKWGSKISIERYLAPNSTIWRQGDYRPALDAWAEWCARHGHSLRLRLYDRRQMVGGDLGRDFAAALGLPDLPIAPEARNVSPSAALIGLYLRLPPIEKLQQINRRMVASGHPAATGSGDLFTPELIAQIRDTYAEPNEAIRSVWFPTRPTLFDLPAAPRPAPADPDGLAGLLLKTITKMRGPEVAEAARIALDRPAAGP